MTRLCQPKWAEFRPLTVQPGGGCLEFAHAAGLLQGVGKHEKVSGDIDECANRMQRDRRNANPPLVDRIRPLQSVAGVHREAFQITCAQGTVIVACLLSALRSEVRHLEQTWAGGDVA